MRIKVDRFVERRERFDFVRAQFGSPDFKQQNDADVVAVIPGFMLNAVVKDEHLALFNYARVIADP